MLFNKMIEAVDTHTSGAPTRIIYNPLTPCLANMAQTLAYWKNNHDWIRKSLMFEPRGYSEMTGTAIVLYPLSFFKRSLLWIDIL